MTTRVEVVPGPGTVVRFGMLAAWVGPDASAALLDWVHQSVRNLQGAAGGGRLIGDHLATVLSAADPEPAVAFVTIGPGEGGLAVLLHGPVQVWDGSSWRSADPRPGWRRLTCPDHTLVAAGPLGVTLPAPTSKVPLDLQAGSVSGGGLLLVPEPSRPVQPRPTSTLATAAGMTSAEHGVITPASPTMPVSSRLDAIRWPPDDPIDLRRIDQPPAPPIPSGGGDRAAAGPTVVRGVHCPSGHFNHPATITCRRCGAAIGPAERRLVSGPRPPLGILLTDDGTIFSLDASYVLGERSGRDPTVTGGIARPLHLAGTATQPVAPTHAEVRLADWSVQVVDRGSTSGTWIQFPGDSGWERLAAHLPRPLRPGGHVAIGPHVLTFLSPWPA